MTANLRPLIAGTKLSPLSCRLRLRPCVGAALLRPGPEMGGRGREGFLRGWLQGSVLGFNPSASTGQQYCAAQSGQTRDFAAYRSFLRLGRAGFLSSSVFFYTDSCSAEMMGFTALSRSLGPRVQLAHAATGSGSKANFLWSQCGAEMLR